MARNIRRTKAPAKHTDRFIEDTLDRLSKIRTQIKTAEDKIEAILDELQIREYMATNRHGPGDHTLTISRRNKR